MKLKIFLIGIIFLLSSIFGLYIWKILDDNKLLRENNTKLEFTNNLSVNVINNLTLERDKLNEVLLNREVEIKNLNNNLYSERKKYNEILKTDKNSMDWANTNIPDSIKFLLNERVHTSQ